MHPESKILGITVRGVIALIVILTVCVMSLLKIPIVEPLYTLVISVSSFYLGSRASMMFQEKNGKPIQPGSDTEEKS